MTKAEEVIEALMTEFVCSCGRGNRPERYLRCKCGMCWAHVTGARLPDGTGVWHREQSRASFKVVDKETGWSCWS